MCEKKSGLLIGGMAMVALTMFFILFTLIDSLYHINTSDQSFLVEMQYDVYDFCVTVQHQQHCLSWTDPAIDGTGEGDFLLRCGLTLSCMSACLFFALLIVICFSTHICNLADLKRGKCFCCLVAFTCIMMIFAIVTPIIPTIELIMEQSNFNSLSSRNDTFYFKAFQEIGVANYLNFTNEIGLIRNSTSPDLQMGVGWSLIVTWFSFLFALIALILFVCAGVQTKKADKERPLNENSMGPRGSKPTIYGSVHRGSVEGSESPGKREYSGNDKTDAGRGESRKPSDASSLEGEYSVGRYEADSDYYGSRPRTSTLKNSAVS